MQSFGNREETDKTIETEAILISNSVEVAVFTETWLTDVTAEKLPFKEYQKFHLCRSKVARNSGGVSICVKNNLPASRLKIQVPDDIECIWVTIRPNWLPRSVSNIIVCGIYYPGLKSDYAPRQADIIFHISTTVQYLKREYANPLFLIMGDFNDLPTRSLCSTCDLKQEVKVPTRGDATLDLILTNRKIELYQEPISLPKIGGGDHFPVLYIPKKYIPPKNIKKIIEIRKFLKSTIILFGAWITRVNWSWLNDIHDVNDKVKYFSSILWKMIDRYFPLVKVVISSTDKEWVTPKIKELINKRQKAHMEGLSELRDSLAKKIKLEIKEAKIKFNESKKEFFEKANPKEWYKHINNIINNGNFSQINLTNIPELSEKTPSEQAEIINEHFAEICREYPQFQFNTVQNDNLEIIKIPSISEFETYKMLIKFAKKALVTGDLPRRILQEFAVELATPFCIIINSSTNSGIFPDEYKKAEITPIPKVNPPKALSDLRPISKTPIGGKMIESVIMKELEKDLIGKLDADQFGNTKGTSTTHYLLNLTNEAYISTDKGNATTAVTIDYSKAFDYVDHSVLIEKLVDLGVRSNIINLIISFLKERSHSTKTLGLSSPYLSITCGVPQGTCSGPRLFVVVINGKKCHFVSSYKFVDDKTIAYSYSGDPTNALHKALEIEEKATKMDKMKINASKCHAITFNFSQNNLLPQNLTLNGNVIENCTRIKLLGVIITNDLKWSDNVQHICDKVNRKLYILSKLKKFGLKTEELIVVWKTILRPLTEYATPLWHSGLTEGESYMLETLQKKALGIILGVIYVDNRRLYKIENKNINYQGALEKLDLVQLSVRRELLTKKFAVQSVHNERHKGMFPLNMCNVNTRNREMFDVIAYTKDRTINSAIPYMTRILNGVSNVDSKLIVPK